MTLISMTQLELKNFDFMPTARLNVLPKRKCASL